MTSDNKRTTMYALIAGAALVGAALVYTLLKDDGSSSGSGVGDEISKPTIDEEKILEGLNKDQLIPCVFEPNQPGVMDKQYFLKFLQFVGSNTLEVLSHAREEVKINRRVAYKKGDWDDYKTLVEKMIKLEDETAQDVLQIACDAAQIDHQMFAQRHMQLSQDPQFAQFVMAAQQGKLAPPKQDATIKLTKQETIKHLKVTAEVQTQSMKNASSTMNQQPQNQDEQMKLVIDMMIEQCKSQDKIFMETNEEHENEDFEAALLHFSQKDPEVAKHLQDYMQKMQAAMPQGMGM